MRVVKWLRVWLIVFAGDLALKYLEVLLFGWGRHSPRFMDQALMAALLATFLTLMAGPWADTNDPSRRWRSAVGQCLSIGLLMVVGVYVLAGAALDPHMPFGGRIVAGVAAVLGTPTALVSLASAVWAWRNRQPR